MEEESLQSPDRKLRRKGKVQKFLDKHMGEPIDILPQNKLLTKLSILLRMGSLQLENKLWATQVTLKKSQAHVTAKEVISIWERTAIDCIHIDKLENKNS